MNKVKIGLGLTAALVLLLFSCNNPLLSKPFIGEEEDANGSRYATPEGLKASHGEKRSITLEWDKNSNAALYYVYKADSLLDTFVRSAETPNSRFKFTVAPGITAYYRVSYVSHDGKESPQSFFVKGTSLAQPFISDITNITESGVTVTWYMENADTDTYKNDLLYTVYCYNGSTEIAQISLDASEITENKASFNNLSANTNYEYQVEAYLRSDQSAGERSDRMDAATARRFRPSAPINLRASLGTSISGINVLLELPEMVDVSLGENQFDPKPIYFTIKRREVNATGSNKYQMACQYFGSDAEKAKSQGALFNIYTPGATVTWTDIHVSRGVEYEYEVQSYVDGMPTGKTITSDTSKASTTGWALSEGTLDFGKISYKANEEGSEYIEAQLPLVFNFDDKNINYDYSLIEQIERFGDGYVHDPISDILWRPINTFSSYEQIKSYARQMNLRQQTTANSPGRGIYSYRVEIKLGGEVIDKIETFGKVEVSEDTDPIIVDGFFVQDGYKDKFVFKWKYRGNRQYELYMSNDRITWDKIDTINANPDDSNKEENDDYSFSYTTNITPDITRNFAIKPSRNMSGGLKQGQIVYATAASRTLGTPVLSLSPEPSYSAITATWKEAQKADTYRIKYWYTGESAKTITVERNDKNLFLNTQGLLEYTFIPYENNTVDVTKAGKDINVEIDALNEGLRKAVGGGEIATTSKEKPSTKMVGPALLAPSATKAISPTLIEVSWNKVTGANGYYVSRRQFDMNNNAEERAAITYYVPADVSLNNNVKGSKLEKDPSTNINEDTKTVKASASLSGSTYTLKDEYMQDNEYAGLYSLHTQVYRDQQNDMAQGYSYRYYIVPVLNEGDIDSIVFDYVKDSSNKNANINYYTIRENGVNIRYTGASAIEQEGFMIGFGQNLTATKGTLNDGIRINWTPPAKLASVAGFSPRYTLYRRASGSENWGNPLTVIDAKQHIDTTAARGIAYEYAVGISNGSSGSVSEPGSARRFIEKCGADIDTRNRPNYLGYMLNTVRMIDVSRNERRGSNGNFGEQVNWYSAGITNSYSTDSNWGIDGYTIYVMNRNINADWHEIADISSNIPNQLTQSVLLTTGMKSVTLSTTVGNMAFDMLRVMRDYKHYFKVRSYVLNDDNVKVYCPDPSYTWSNGGENDYVKWGARQVTTDEYIKIVTLFIANGVQEVNGTAWNTGYFGKDHNADGTGTSGKVHAESNFGVTSWTFTFTNYREDINTRAGDWPTFIKLDGKVWAQTSATNQYPNQWGDEAELTVTGPADTPNLYSGKASVGQKGNTNLGWGNSGNNVVTVTYPPGTAKQVIPYKGEDTPLQYSGRGDRRLDLEHFK